MRRSLLVSAIAASAALFAPSIAQAESCADATNMTSFTGYLACAGSFVGNLNGSAAELTQLNTLFPSGANWSYAGKSDDAGTFGPFTGNPNTQNSGNLNFDNPINGLFVVGIKTGNNYSFYLYNGSSTTTVPFQTIGTAGNANNGGNDLSHAALYLGANTTITTNSVPEPSTYVLMASGLLGLGFAARRRRQA